MKKNTEIHKTVLKLTEDLLIKLDITCQIKIEEKDDATWVILETPEPGLLIGRYGRNLESIQIILGQMVFHKIGEWFRIIVTVGDYREKREQQLKEMAVTSAQKVLATKEPVVLANLTPAERRIVHMELAANSEVVSQSEGEDNDRRLVIKLR